MADRLPTPARSPRPARTALRGFLVGAAAVVAGGFLATAPASATTAHLSASAATPGAQARCDPDYLGPANPVLISGQRFAAGAVGPVFERPPR